MNRRLLILLCHIMVALTALAAGDTTGVVYSVVKMQVDHLPEMRIPRTGHQAMYVGDELVVMGGHTSGFVPTPTAEYLANNTWHTLNMVYTHDCGTCVRLSSGQILLLGGMERELGIGQTFTVERYDPATHVFQGFACLDKKRAFASAAELAQGKVVIAGNWYNDDYIECFDGKSRSDSVKPVTMQRTAPVVLQVASDEAIIFGGIDTHGKQQFCTTVDCYRGEPYDVPLLGQWNPIFMVRGEIDFFVGDKGQGRYEYLVPAANADGQVGIIRVLGKQFELLGTACPIPMHSPWSEINYGQMLVDRKARRAYLVGFGKDTRLYVAAVDYGKVSPTRGAPVTLYYSEPFNHPWIEAAAAISPEGDLVVTGGSPNSNYAPFATVVKLHVAPVRTEAAGWRWLFWIGLLAVAAIVAVVVWGGRRTQPQNPVEDNGHEQQQAAGQQRQELMQRIDRLMQEQQVYLQPEFKLSDLAVMLDASTVRVSRCIKAERDCSFSQLVNRFRIDHAQRMMREQPDSKLSAVALASGFANETSFFRVFKSVTGLTPKEWLQLNS